MVVVTEESLANRVEESGAREHNRDEGVRERVAADLFKAVVNLHRGDARIVKNKRHAQLGESPHKHDRASAEKPGFDQWQGDLKKTAEAGAAEILRGFLHRWIDVGECGDRVEVDDRIERKRFNQGNAPKLVGRKPVKGPAVWFEAEVDDEG